MDIGMIGLGRMGANLSRRLVASGHRVVGFDPDPTAVDAVTTDGVHGVNDLNDLFGALVAPRVLWVMVPAGITDAVIADVAERASAGDTIIDGGNSRWTDDLARAPRVAAAGIHYVDVGTSGGVFGLERGFCLMVGGEPETVARLAPIFDALAPGEGAAPATPGAVEGTARRGWLHCGPVGAGHFVKMVHNGIEYGMMAALAEGLALLDAAKHGATAGAVPDAETTPLAHPERYQYDFDTAAIAEVWRRGSVIGSWLLDLTAAALAASPELTEFTGRVSDSGEGRWTVDAAVELGVPIPVIASSLWDRFSSRGNADFEHKVLSAMRAQFGGHAERP